MKTLSQYIIMTDGDKTVLTHSGEKTPLYCIFSAPTPEILRELLFAMGEYATDAAQGVTA